MRFACLALALAGLSPAYAEDWNFKSTQGLIVGVLQWRDQSLAPFSDRLRKDRELYEVLLRRGVPRNRLFLLLDREATRARIEERLKESAAAASADSTFFFYYAGHGLKQGSTAYIANYDIDADSPAQSGVSIQRIARILAEHFKGRRIVFSGDFCYSGAFEEALRILNARGKEGILLTSSSASNQCSSRQMDSTGSPTQDTTLPGMNGSWKTAFYRELKNRRPEKDRHSTKAFLLAFL